MRAPAKQAPSAPVIDILVESTLWEREPGVEGLLRKAINEAVRTVALTLAERAPAQAAVAIVLVDDAAIRALNRHWRDRDEPTNVLSFPTGGHVGPVEAVPLGDIVIACETTAREAAAEDKPFADHLAHLAVHGFLHLMGYDHESDDNAEAMECLERSILAGLGIADPYAARDSAT